MLNHKVFYPNTTFADEFSRRPLVVFLHGLGGSMETSKHGLPEIFTSRGAIVVFPDGTFPCFPDSVVARRWYTQLNDDLVTTDRALESIHALHQLIEMLRGLHNPSKIILAGFSQGGTMSVTYPLVYPKNVDVSVCFSGYIIADPQIPIAADVVKGTKFIWFHGTEDDDNPYYLATRGVDALRNAGADVTLHTHAGGHWVPVEGLDALVSHF